MMIEKGRYRHFKGGEYEVLFNAVNSETLEEMVVYRSIADPQKIWVRPTSMWNEKVLRDGREYTRFTFIGK